MNSDDKILKGTVVRMMNERPYKILEDTVAHGKALMVQVNEDFSEIPDKEGIYCILLLDEIYGDGDNHQSILYNSFLEKEKEKEFLNRKEISRFEIMEI